MRRRLAIYTAICMLFISIMGGGSISSVQAANMQSYLDLNGYSITMSDIRDANSSVSFCGSDGKQAIIVFGGISTCSNTMGVLNNLNKLVTHVDMEQLNIYVMEVAGASDSLIRSSLDSMDISEKIVVNSVDNYWDFFMLHNSCFAMIGSSYTMPLILYKGADGMVYNYTTAYSSYESIVENVRAGGLEVTGDTGTPGDTGTTAIQVTGKYCQTEVRSMLEMVNQLRTGSDAWYWNEDNKTKSVFSDLGELVYDYELEKVAMQRAMELVASFSHNRPDGTSCFTAESNGTRSYGENIAVGYRTAEAVFTAWAEADEDYSGQGHRRNMLKDSYTTVGMACVYYSGYYFWVQEFGYTPSGASATKAVDTKQTVSVQVLNSNITSCSIQADRTSYTISGGASQALPVVSASMELTGAWPWVTISAVVPVQWESADPAIANVSNGVISAVGSGHTTLTGTFMDTYQVSVSVWVGDMGDLIGRLENAGPGETIEAALDDTAVLPQAALEAIQGKNITLTLALNNGILWSLNGTKVPSSRLQEMNLSVTRTAKNAGNISAAAVNALAGEKAAEQLVFGQSGAFSFSPQLILGMTGGNTGEKGVLLQAVSSGGELVLADSALVQGNNISFTVTRGADSVVVYGTNGDTNGDDKVNITDMMQVLHHVSRRSSLNVLQQGFADVDMNGSVNLQDLMRTLHYVSGRSSSVY